MGRVVLGEDIDTGKPVILTPESRRLSTYIVGKPGTGKSALLSNIARQDLENGDGLCLLDPHEDLANGLLKCVPPERRDGVIFWDPADLERPFGLNPFYCPDPKDYDSRADNFIAALSSVAEFTEVFETAPRMKDVLIHLAIAFVANQGRTLSEAPKFLTHEDFRPRFYQRLSSTYPQVLEFWETFDGMSERKQQEMTESSLNKLRRFQTDRRMYGIFSQPKNSIDFRWAMDEGKIIIVKLFGEELGENNAAFIGAFVVWEIFQAALSRKDIPEDKRRQFHLIADEFQTFMTTAFPRLIEQARKFGVDVTVAHQTRAQLTERSKAATLVVGNKIFFGVTGQDGVDLAKEVEKKIPEPPVATQKQKYQFDPNPFDHVQERGHDNLEVVETHRKLSADITSLIDRVIGFRDKIPLKVRDGRGLTREEAIERGLTTKLDRKSRGCIIGLAVGASVFLVGLMVLSLLTGAFRSLWQAVLPLLISIPLFLFLLFRGVKVKPGSSVSSALTLKAVNEGFDKLEKKELHRIFEEECRRGLRKPHSSGTGYSLRAGELGMITHSEQRWDMEAVDGQKLSLRREELTQAVNEILYGIMRKEEKWETLSEEKIKEKMSPVFFGLYEVLYPVDLMAMAVAPLEEVTLREREICSGVVRLGFLLAETPCYIQTGQLETTLEKPRLYSDVEAEISNQLSNLPRFQAWGKIVEDGRNKEYIFKTIKPKESGSGSEGRAEEIKRRSRDLYGRPNIPKPKAIEEPKPDDDSIFEKKPTGRKRRTAKPTADQSGS